MSDAPKSKRIAEGGSDQSLVRRALIVDFFKLGEISRWDVCEKGGWIIEDEITNYERQALWALAFERAEKRGELALMRELIDSANSD